MPDDAGLTPHRAWSGTTYYGRPQVKPAPFNNALVGGYIFLAGLSGGAMILSTLLDLLRGRAAERTIGRGRYLALLAPTVGTGLLVADLHTPRRFYNMLRLFKTTSAMSIGSWLLVGFGLFSTLTAAAHRLARASGRRWLRGVARAAQVPAAATGAGLATYTASLLAGTSTPLWAAAPRALAVKFGASSMAAGAAALSLGEGRSSLGRDLDKVALAALAVELAATVSQNETYRRVGITEALETLPGSDRGDRRRWPRHRAADRAACALVAVGAALAGLHGGGLDWRSWRAAPSFA